MRSYLIERTQKNNIQLIEKAISIDEVKNADEVFLTNVIKGIVPVHSFMNRSYTNEFINKLHDLIALQLCDHA
jgi:branched-chain amino acid aminotransferase